MMRYDGFGGYGGLGNLQEFTQGIKSLVTPAASGLVGAAAAAFLAKYAGSAVRGDPATVKAEEMRAKAAPYVQLATPFVGAYLTRRFVSPRYGQIGDAAAVGMAIYGLAQAVMYFLPVEADANAISNKIRQYIPIGQALAGLGSGIPNFGIQRFNPFPSGVGAIPPTQTRVIQRGVGAIAPTQTQVRRVGLSRTAASVAGMY